MLIWLSLITILIEAKVELEAYRKRDLLILSRATPTATPTLQPSENCNSTIENFIKEFQPLQLLWMVGGASAPTNIPIM